MVHVPQVAPCVLNVTGSTKINRRLRQGSLMKITYIHQYFNTPQMVGSTRSYEMARRLVQMGHEVNLITTTRDGDKGRTWRVTNEAGIKVHWISIPYSNKMGFGARLHAFLLFGFYAARKAASISADAILATSTPLTIALPAIYAKWRQNIPMVLEVRDLWPEVPIAMGALGNPFMAFMAKCLEKFAYANSASIVALSPDMRVGVGRTGYPEARIHVIPNGADPELFDASGILGKEFRDLHSIPADATLMVYAGTLGKVNGVSYLVKLASAMLADRRFFVLIIGDGAESDKVRLLAQSTGCLGKNLIMIPPVPKNQMRQVLNAADIVISTVIPIKALWANSANKIFDGMAAGCCIAINHGGWLAELLRERHAGIVLSPVAAEAALQVKALIDSPRDLQRMKSNAQGLADSLFSRDALANKLDAVLKNVS